jgi:hypothetical protein
MENNVAFYPTAAGKTLAPKATRGGAGGRSMPRQYHASSRFFANVDSMAADFSGAESVKIGVLHQLLEISTCPWPIKTEKFGRMAS